MNNDSGIPILGRKKICRICGESSHPFTTKCNYNTLVKRIQLLAEANDLIPSLLAANDKLTQAANNFRRLAKDSATVITVCESTVKEFDNGEHIWARFLERLEKEWPQTSSLDIDENLLRSNQEPTSLTKTNGTVSTSETAPGTTTEQDSSPLIPGATPAESPLQ